jgi:hypothetical protein
VALTPVLKDRNEGNEGKMREKVNSMYKGILI